MRGLLSLLPRPVMISAATAIFVILAFAILIPVLGGARDEAIARGQQLAADISGSQAKVSTMRSDVQYVVDNRAEYEALLASDKLIPHTRRAAVVSLQETAGVHGLSALNYSFSAADATSRAAVASQTSAGGYTVAVETIELTLGAPLDGAVYRFIADIMQSFPGSLVLDSMELSRAPDITSAALAAVSEGRDSKIVDGNVTLTWRTAQADKTSGAKETAK